MLLLKKKRERETRKNSDVASEMFCFSTLISKKKKVDTFFLDNTKAVNHLTCEEQRLFLTYYLAYYQVLSRTYRCTSVQDHDILYVAQ